MSHWRQCPHHGLRHNRSSMLSLNHGHRADTAARLHPGGAEPCRPRGIGAARGHGSGREKTGAPGGGHRHQGRHRPGDQRLFLSRHGKGAGHGSFGHSGAHGYARRAVHCHAVDHPGHHHRAGAGHHLRDPGRGPGGERRDLYPLCEPRGGDGAGHQSRRSHAGADEVAPARGRRQAQEGRQEGRRQDGQRQEGHEGQDRRQGGQRQEGRKEGRQEGQG